MKKNTGCWIPKKGFSKKRLAKLSRMTRPGKEIPKNAPNGARDTAAFVSVVVEDALDIDQFAELSNQLERIYGERDQWKIERLEADQDLEEVLKKGEAGKLTVVEIAGVMRNYFRLSAEINHELDRLFSAVTELCAWRAARHGDMRRCGKKTQPKRMDFRTEKVDKTLEDFQELRESNPKKSDSWIYRKLAITELPTGASQSEIEQVIEKIKKRVTRAK